MDSLQVLEGCDIELTYKKGVFKGSTNDRDCTNQWGKAAYTTTKVVIDPKKMISWDQGWNEEGKQVWGAEKGGYIFIKEDH